jgi:hypothetical protein
MKKFNKYKLGSGTKSLLNTNDRSHSKQNMLESIDSRTNLMNSGVPFTIASLIEMLCGLIVSL